MDPFSALGLASNVIQFVDFSTKLISRSLELYDSTSGASSANIELESISKDLSSICTGLTKPESRIESDATESEMALIALSLSCKELADEFLNVLRGLKVSGQNKKWQSARQALRSTWKEKQIRQYQKRLDTYRSQIATHLITILGGQQSKLLHGQSELLAQQSKVAATLDDLAESHRRLEITGVNQPAQLRRDILASLQGILASSSERNELDLLKSQLSALATEGGVLGRELKVLDSLRFNMISTREERITDAHPKTLNWLFEEMDRDKDSPGVTILDWLQRCNGVYWVSGKAGSGKSTMMKYLCKNKRTLTALSKWAGEKELFVASFYFWNVGTDMQKSQQGLLQTLLYDVLRQCSTLIPVVCCSRWQMVNPLNIPWTRTELLDAFMNLKKETIETTRFCFFIDGLDEYEGDQMDIIDIVNQFASINDIKVCFSSRPWNVFEMAYGDNNGRKLRLQDLTRGDIKYFVTENLREDRLFRQLQGTDIRCEDLVMEVTDRAQGVFLWVFLVVRSLRRGLTNFDTISELQARLRELPTDLETYFKHMLDSTERIYHRQAAQIYLMRLSTPGSLTAMTVSCFDQEGSNFGLEAEISPWSSSKVRQRLGRTRTRVVGRCLDLLEISSDNNVDFLHRTVSDFLETPEIHKLLISRAGAEFDAHVYLCNAMLYQMKRLPQTPQNEDETGFHPEITFHERFPFERLAVLFNALIYHAFMLDLKGNSMAFQLVQDLDRVIAFLRRINNNMKEYDAEWRALNLRQGHKEGWLVTIALGRGLYGYLSRETPMIRSLIKKGGFDGRPLLDVAVQPIKHLALGMTRNVAPDSRIVRLLLEQGADPNQSYRGSSVSEQFLEDLAGKSGFASPVTRRAYVTIIELLLTHGADPDCIHLRTAIANLCTSEEEAHMEDLLIRQRQIRLLKPAPRIERKIVKIGKWLPWSRRGQQE